ncbi:PAS domain-containing hybrid sensor histidine kinase/response regulator [Paractinoplanes globisporus]|uniref:histidine kinase n=1 Tax=Paractinoplanes globisporus TaxID=113565 RepID=A0ABW6WS70_9ACTN|nr:PAS domain S-box protein [Actinoplanes globisporus]
MSSSPAAGERPASRLARFFSQALGSLTVALGVALLAAPVLVPALCLILLGAGTFLRRRGSVAVFPLLAAVTAVAGMFDDRFGDGLAPRTMILPLITQAGEMHPTPGAITGFLVLAVAQLLTERGRPPWIAAGQAAAICGGVIGLLAVYGLAFQAPALTGSTGYRALSLATAAGIVATAAAALAPWGPGFAGPGFPAAGDGPPGAGLVWVLADHTVSAMQTRRMLAAALIVLPMTGWLVAAGWYDAQLEAAFLVAANVGIVSIVSLVTGSRAARMEKATIAARVDLGRHVQMETILRNTPTAFSIKGLDGCYRMASAAFEELYGIPPGTTTGRFDRDVHTPERLAEMRRRDRLVVEADGPLVFEDEMTGEHGTRTFITTLFALREEGGQAYAVCGVTTEITRLRIAESKFKALLDASPEAMLCIDTDGSVLLANARAGQVFRRRRDQLIGMPVDALVPLPLDEPPPRPVQLTAHCGDGTECPVEINLSAVEGEGGTVVFATVQDITERLAQAQSDAQLAGIVAASSDAIVSKTLDGTILTWNPGAERLYGYTAEEMIGRDVTVILPLDRPDEEKRLLARVRSGELIKHHETRRMRHDGSTIYVSLSMAPIRDPDGTIVGASTISHDITAEVEAERRLRFEREQFQTIMTAASDPFVSMDYRGLITEWNRQAEQVFGWTREQVLGRHVVDTILPRRYAAALDRVLEGRWAWLLDRPTEMGAVRADGTELPIELTMWRIRRDGPSTFHAFARDISARRQTELALAQARDQAVETARLKSQFLASMSHEIRTPMNGVIGLSGLLLGTELTETQRRYAQGINSAGVALLAVINDVLDFSKLEAGKVVLERANFEIWRLLDEVVGLVADASGAKELTVSSRCHPDLSALVSGDAGKLRQVLLNLAGNAVKFTASGTVAVTAEPAVGDFPPGSVPVRFEVSDTGIGIDADQQAGLFEPFIQADAGTTRRFGGTGLGLAISRELVGALGGEIGLRSEAGTGSTFWFTVALWPAVEDAESPRRHALDGLRVLLMAGAETAAIADQLGAWVVETSAVPDEASAIGSLVVAAEAGRPFDVAILDSADLPPMIVGDPVIPTPKLVLVGGEPSPPGRARSAGFNAVLTRPVRQSQLYDALVGLFAPPAEDRALRITPASPLGRGHVLLVEDNDINQTVALGILANLGYSADVAANGREAVEKAAMQDYQAIFMDCLMPEMDGYEATAAIRRAEGTSPHVPIIAMTAGALPEDRARCLGAGMDDHLAKPLMPATVGLALERWARPVGPHRQIERRLDQLRGAGAALGPAELAGLLRRLSAHAPGHVEEIHQAVAADDADRLREQAHQLKGVAANLGVPDLAAVCERLEQVARDGDLDAAIEPLSRLRPRTREMLAAIDAILAGLEESNALSHP